MTWALQFDGINNYATVPVWTPLDRGEWSVEVDLILGDDIASDQFIVGSEDSGAERTWKMFLNDGKFGLLHVSNWSVGGFILSQDIAANTRYKVKAELTGGVFSLHLDAALQGSATRTTSLNDKYLTSIGRSLSVGLPAEMGLVSITCTDPNDSDNNRYYDADASDHNSGSDPTTNPFILTDTAGGNNATGVNMTTANWIDLGGGGGVTRISKLFDFNLTLTGHVTKNHALVGELLKSVSKDFSLVTSLLSSIKVSKDFTISVDLLQGMQTDYVAITNMVESVSSGNQFNIDLFNRKVKGFSVSVGLLKREFVNHLQNVNFHNKVDKSFQFNIDLFEGVKVSKPFSLVANLTGRIQKTFDFELELLQRLTRNNEIVATLLNKVTIDFINRFNLLERVNDDFTISLDLIERVDNNFKMVFRINSDIIIKTPAHYIVNVAGTIEFKESEPITIVFDDGVNKSIV